MFLLPLTGDRKPTELKREDFFGRGGRFSPDGKYLAFNSNDSGRFQIYVRPLDPSTAAVASAGTRSQVSTRKAESVVSCGEKTAKSCSISRSRRGRRSWRSMFRPVPSFESRTPKPLFEIPSPIVAPAQLSTVCSPDGERFVFAVNVPARAVR